ELECPCKRGQEDAGRQGGLEHRIPLTAAKSLAHFHSSFRIALPHQDRDICQPRCARPSALVILAPRTVILGAVRLVATPTVVNAGRTGGEKKSGKPGHLP